MEGTPFRSWAPQRTDILAVRGETISFNMEFESLDQDLETASFSCKNPITDVVVISKSLENGITKVGTNLYSVRVAPEDTQSLEAGRYPYDLFVGANDDAFAIMTGDLLIRENVNE